MVPETGFEPVWSIDRGILSPLRLPDFATQAQVENLEVEELKII